MSLVSYDAIVVGGGATGGIAAKVLTEGGLSVALLEAGGLPSSDALEEISRERQLGYTRCPEDIVRSMPIQSTCYACRGALAKWFVKDELEPYKQRTPFSWIRMRGIGGRLLAWEGQCYRLGDFDFKAASRDGFGSDWPLSYRDLAPAYGLLENYLGVTGSAEGLLQVPDGRFRKPVGKNVTLDLLREPLRQSFSRIITPARLASMMCRNHREQAYRYAGKAFGPHVLVTPWKAMQDATSTGLLNLLNDVVALKLIISHEAIKGVVYFDRCTSTIREVRGRRVLLCGSTLESTRLMLSSDIRTTSGLLGVGLMDHWMGAGASGTTEVPSEDFYGSSFQRHRGYIPRFRNVECSDSPFLRGYGFQVKTISNPEDPVPSRHSRMIRVRVIISGFGETLSASTNRVVLDSDLDAFGRPQLAITMTHGPNEIKMAIDASNQAAEILEKAGIKNVMQHSTMAPPGLSIHEVGTARMGLDPNTSVLDSFCQSHEVRNLYVTDGACWVTSACQNPTLTMLAITVRTCQAILKERLMSPGGRKRRESN